MSDDIIHRRQECGEYYQRGHEREKQPRQRQRVSEATGREDAKPTRINTVGLVYGSLCVSFKTTNTYDQ